MIKGHPTVWLDGFTKTISPDEFAAYPSNTGLSHALINNTNDEVIYLCIGETQEFPTEKISYPLNPLRQKECRRKGWYWDDLKTPVTGSKPAKSEKYKKEHLEFQVCTESDSEQILEIFKKSPKYFLKVDGSLPTIEMAKKALVDGPQKFGDDSFKEFLMIKLNGEPIGVLDVHAHHPEKEICYLGLLLISENLFSKGLGRKCYQLAEDYIFRALRCQKIRLGISKDNDVTGFWQKMSFEKNGKTYEWVGENKNSFIQEFDKIIK